MTNQQTRSFARRDSFRAAARETLKSITVGFTLTMLVLGALVHWAGVGSVVEGNILGFGFQLSTAFFFLVTGIARSLKRVPVFSSTVYRLFHFTVSAALFYVAYFVMWQPLSVALGEQEVDNLSSGATNWAFVVLAYVLFLTAYFATVGVRVALARAREREQRDRAAYESMLEKKNTKQ